MEKRASTPSPMDIMGGSRDEEDGSCSRNVTTMRTAETLLRLVPMTLCIAALVVMLKNSQTNDYGSLSYSDLGAFRFSIPAYTHTHTETHICVCVCVCVYSYMYIFSFSYTSMQGKACSFSSNDTFKYGHDRYVDIEGIFPITH